MARRGATCTLICLLALSGAARAEDIEGDTALARTYFQAGQEDYARGDYARALAAFEEARRLRPLAELDYDIATCYEKLDRPRSAIELFTRFLDESPNAPNAAEIHARIDALRARLSNGRRYVVPGVVLGAALALGATGAALVGSVASPLSSIDRQWDAMPTSALQDRAWALRDRAIAGDVVLGVAGAVAIVDVVLWARAARRGRR